MKNKQVPKPDPVEVSKAIANKGFCLIFVLFLFFVVMLILTIMFFSVSELTIFTSEGEYRVIGILSVTLVVLIAIVIGLSFFVFIKLQKVPILILLGFNSLTMIFTLSVSIFCLIAGSIGSTEKYLGCQTPMRGLFNRWQAMDQLIAIADQTTCTANCACKITKETYDTFINNNITKPIFLNYYKTEIGDQSDQFIKCSSEFTKSKQTVLKYFNSKIYDTNDFAKYWKRIEKKYKCVGWCATSSQIINEAYIKPGDKDNSNIEEASEDEKTLYETMPDQIPFIKYIFSDVNRGIPEHRGCMGQILKKVPKLLITFGSLGLVIGICQIIITILLICLLKNMMISSKGNQENGNQKQQSNENINQLEERPEEAKENEIQNVKNVENA